MRVKACAVLQIVALALGVRLAGAAGAVRDLPGFRGNALLPCDDISSTCLTDPGTPRSLGFTIDFFDTQISGVFVNNNGNVTFDGPLDDFVPFDLTQTQRQIIAPFFADVDTRAQGSGVVVYGTDTVDGHPAFGVIWDNVGYYDVHTDLLNRFQLVLIDRSDTGPGNFDIEFDYDRIAWEAGDIEGVGGLANEGTGPRAGYSNGGDTSLQLGGSGSPRAFLDGTAATALTQHGFGSTQPGRYVFPVRDGRPSAVDVQGPSRPVPSSRAAAIVVHADPGSACEAQLFAVSGDMPAARAVPSSKVRIDGPTPLVSGGFAIGEPVSGIKTKTVGRKGRAKLKLRLNATGKALLKTPDSGGQLVVLVRTTVRTPQLPIVLDRLLTFRRGR